MKIAVVKPDYKIIGGFEIVVDKIISGLKNYGHEVDLIKVDMTNLTNKIGDLEIPWDIYNGNQEFFRYASAIEEFKKLNLDMYDIVLATQPPSFAVNHKNVAVLFYHHHKIYYDLYDIYMECGITNKNIHKSAKDIIREIDSKFITQDKYYIAGSDHVANRLRKFNGIKENIYTFAAGIDDEFYSYNGRINYINPICVGRHEFPKRPELFIHAMKHVDKIKGKVIGEGGRTENLKKIDKYLSYIHDNNQEIEDNYLWKNVMFNIDKIYCSKYENIKNTNIIFTGKLSKKKLIEEYANALCVVCPAYEEDYGLTAIEAMSFRKPVIVCKDGGGYIEFIKDGENGFIVEPTGEAIAEKINYLRDNPNVLDKMGKNAYEFSRKYSWDKSIKVLNDILVSIKK